MPVINGKQEDCAGMRLAEYLTNNGYKRTHIAIECNERILPKEEYENKVIEQDDVIEIVSFVGGGSR